METFLGILIPFLGTTLGSACVFFMKKSLSDLVRRSLAGFAAGVMVAASIWSLLIPAIEQSEDMGKLSFLPAFIGFWVGVLFLLLLDRLIPHLHVGSEQAEGPKSKLGRTTMMVLAVTLHNEWQSAWCMQAFFRAIRKLLRQAHWRCPSALPFKIFPKVRLSPCRSGRRGYARAERFSAACFPALSSLSARC